MKLVPALLVFVLVVSANFLSTDGKRGKEKRKRVGLRERRVNLEEKQDGMIEFPRELQYAIDIEGEGTRDLNLELNPLMQMPSEKRNGQRKVAFYTDINTGESFACRVRRKNGKVKCKVAGIIEKKDETCYLSPNSNTAECVSSDGYTDGVLVALGDNGESVIDIQSPGKITSARAKRSILPEPGFKVIEIAFVADEAFMLPFYNRNTGDDAAAEEEAELYATLLANEMSVFYRSVKEVSGGQLDLVLYPAAFRHPGKGKNFDWSQNNIINGGPLINGDQGLPDFATFAANNLSDVQYDHAMSLTGLDINTAKSGSGVIGIAYLSTVCRNGAGRVSIQENTGYNLGWIASHELGHALGALHDSDYGCASQTNLMSGIIFNPSQTTQDTFTKFSSCSVNAFVSHLGNQPDCTASNGFTDEQFQASFCKGFLGASDMSLDRQCQTRTGSSTASACSATVPASGCYSPSQVSCRNSPGASCASSLRFVWNGSPCGPGMVCYKGYCVAEFNICPVISSTTQAPITTSTIPTTTSTVPSTTSTVQSTTSTVPSTTSTVQSTTSTVPSTTSTEPSTTSTVPSTTSTVPSTTSTEPSTTSTVPATTSTVPSTTSTVPSTTSTAPATPSMTTVGPTVGVTTDGPTETTTTACNCCDIRRSRRRRCCRTGYKSGVTCGCCPPLTTPKPCSCCGLRRRQRRRCCRKSLNAGFSCACC